MTGRGRSREKKPVSWCAFQRNLSQRRVYRSCGLEVAAYQADRTDFHLSDLTQESRVEVALPLAIKDWVRLRLKETRQQREVFEQRYGMDFSAFQQAWQEGHIADKHSYEVERDYWEWEAAETDEERLQQMLASLP